VNQSEPLGRTLASTLTANLLVPPAQVNLFDTGQAARELEFPSPGLAYLLQHLCGVKADKRFQVRPC
jgi:ribonuclease D